MTNKVAIILLYLIVMIQTNNIIIINIDNYLYVILQVFSLCNNNSNANN